MSAQSDIRATWTQKKTAARDGQRPEYDAAVGYINGDMQADTESMLSSRYRAAQAGGRPDSMIEGVSVALVQQYVDEMASLYTGTVTRRVYGPDHEEDTELTDLLAAHLDRIGFNQRMRAIERTTLVARSCAQAWGVDLGRLDPTYYPPQDVYPVKPPKQSINTTNQDAYKGFVLDLRADVNNTQREFVYVTPEQNVHYTGRSVRDVDNTKVQKNPLTWPQQKLNKQGQPTGLAQLPIQPVVIWHDKMPMTGELMPLDVPILYRANRWMNVLWSVMLNVLRFQAGATEVRSGIDRDAQQMLEPTGVFFPALLEPGENMTYASAGNDYDGAFRLLNAFAKTLGQSLSMAPSDLSIDGKVESGVARLIANIPKERRRAERAEHFGLLESEYVWPRAASGMQWLGEMPARARKAYMVTEYRPKPLPISQKERIEVENHDLEIGVTTPAHILAERNGTSIDDAQLAINAMRDAQDDAAKEDLAAGTPLTGEQVKALSETIVSISDGTINIDTGRAMLQVAFKLSETQVSALLDPVEVAEELPSEPPPVDPASPPVEDQPPAPEPSPGNGSRSLIERLVAGNAGELGG